MMSSTDEISLTMGMRAADLLSCEKVINCTSPVVVVFRLRTLLLWSRLPHRVRLQW